MLQCSHCGMWHHFDCVRLKTSDTIGVWPCPRCRQQTAMVTSCHTMLNDISKKMAALSHLQEEVLKQLAKLGDVKKLEQLVREHLYQTKVPCEFCGESKPPIQIC